MTVGQVLDEVIRELQDYLTANPTCTKGAKALEELERTVAQNSKGVIDWDLEWDHKKLGGGLGEQASDLLADVERISRELRGAHGLRKVVRRMKGRKP